MPVFTFQPAELPVTIAIFKLQLSIASDPDLFLPETVAHHPTPFP